MLTQAEDYYLKDFIKQTILRLQDKTLQREAINQSAISAKSIRALIVAINTAYAVIKAREDLKKAKFKKACIKVYKRII